MDSPSLDFCPHYPHCVECSEYETCEYREEHDSHLTPILLPIGMAVVVLAGIIVYLLWEAIHNVH